MDKVEANKAVVAVVVPCYNEQEALGASVPKLVEILEKLSERGLASDESFVVLVNDGSKDATWSLIGELAGKWKPGRVRGLSLAHNRGHQYALLAGLMEVKDICDAAISIDADLQDDPEAMVSMVEKWHQGAEIVYGVRRSRATDTWFKRNSARAFYKLQKVMGLETVYDHADYRLMSARALQLLSEYGERNLFLRGIVPQIGLTTDMVHYDRAERVAGESKYPLRKMLAFSIDGITSFSARPMRWIFNIGLLLLVLDLIVAIYVVASILAGKASVGWSSLMVSVWFLGSLILMSIGIVGEYIGKIFVEVKSRPRFAIGERIGF